MKGKMYSRLDGVFTYEGIYDTAKLDSVSVTTKLHDAGIDYYIHWETDSSELTTSDWYYYKSYGNNGSKMRLEEVPKALRVLHLIYGGG